MGDPEPKQVNHHPLGGEMEHLFTKSLTEDDTFGLRLTGKWKDYLQRLPDQLLHNLASEGLEVEIFTPNHTDWVAISFERSTNTFRLEKLGWLQITYQCGFNVNDSISCWSLYHSDVGPYGILSLIIEKGPKENDGKQLEDADTDPEEEKQ